MIQYNRCNLQKIGETKRRLKDRFDEHRRAIENPNSTSKPSTAAEHLLSSPNHTANDMQLMPIEKIFSNRDPIRKAREAFLIQKGRTIDPDDLNIREETYQSFPVISFYHMLIFYLLCNSSLDLTYFRFYKIKLHINTYQCKNPIVPEEGWFGQPKYSTSSKNHLMLCRFLLLYSLFVAHHYQTSPSR